MDITKDQFTDVIGENLESLIALTIGLLPHPLDNFSVANELVIGGDNYRYQFVLGREGEDFYEQMEDNFREADLI